MIEFSERESALFKLRFGRATVKKDFKDWDAAKKQLIDLDLDYMRLKVTNPHNDFVAMLSSLAPHVYLTGVIRLYKIKVDQRPAAYFNPDIIFKRVEPGEKQILKDLIRNSYTDYPMGNYQYPDLAKKFPLEIQLENVSSYLSDFYDGTQSNKEAHIGYIDDKPVACFTSDISDPVTTDNYYAGIIKEYRDKGVFRDILKCLCHLCIDRGAKEFIGGGRMENLPSQHAIEKEKGICYGHELVYMLGFK